MLFRSRRRKSVRKFLVKPIEDQKLNEILLAARLAPSGNNRQPWSFIVIKDELVREEVSVATNNQMWIATAPVVIVAVADICAMNENYADMIVDEETNLETHGCPKPFGGAQSEFERYIEISVTNFIPFVTGTRMEAFDRIKC